MELSRKNIFNLLIWIFVLIFMSIKSMDNSLNIYQVTSDQAFRDLQNEYERRNSYLTVVAYQPGLKSIEETTLTRLLRSQKNESNLNKNLLINVEISDFLDQNLKRILFTKIEKKRIFGYEDFIDQALFSYSIHAEAYNKKLNQVHVKIYRLVRSFFLSWSFVPAQVVGTQENIGIIVDR